MWKCVNVKVCKCESVQMCKWAILYLRKITLYIVPPSLKSFHAILALSIASLKKYVTPQKYFTARWNYATGVVCQITTTELTGIHYEKVYNPLIWTPSFFFSYHHKHARGINKWNSHTQCSIEMEWKRDIPWPGWLRLVSLSSVSESRGRLRVSEPLTSIPTDRVDECEMTGIGKCQYQTVYKFPNFYTRTMCALNWMLM